MLSHGLGVGGRIALMVGEVGKRGSAAVSLLAIPDADVVRVGPNNEQQTCAEGLAPMRGCAELVRGDVGEFARRLTAAETARRVADVG